VPGHADEDPVFGYLVAPRHYSRWCAAVHSLWSEHLQIQDAAKRTTGSQLWPGGFNEGSGEEDQTRFKRSRPLEGVQAERGQAESVQASAARGSTCAQQHPGNRPAPHKETPSSRCAGYGW
jgi:hypothetical protein